MGCEALSLIENAHFFRWVIVTGKVVQTDLAFVTHIRSAHARLQVSVCSGYDLYHTQTAL